jgi:hypothetical protein
MLDWLVSPWGDSDCELPTWHSAEKAYAESEDFLDHQDRPGSPGPRVQKARVAPEEERVRGVALV